LADDIAAEPDPRATRQFQAQAAGLCDGPGHRPAQSGRFEDDEERLRPTSERGQPAQPIRDEARAIRGREPATGEIQDEQIHRPTGQQRTGDGKAFVEGGRGDDHEPLEANAARDGLDRVEGAGEIQPRDDPTRDLRLGDHAEREGGPAARTVAADRDARRARQASGAEDGVQAGKPGVDDPVVGTGVVAGLAGERLGRERGALVVGERGVRRRGDGQRSDDLRSCRSPSSLEARQGRRHVRGEGRHAVVRIEQMFY
jgi:hypothetical protein